MKPLEVFALDANMNRATGSIPYTSLIWTRRYNECGEFQMSVPCDIYDRSWAYIYADDRPETGIIEKVEYTDDALAPGGRDTITVSGRFLESILNRVTFLVEQPEEKTIEIHVPEPKSPGIRRADMPTVYRDPDTGKFIYKNSSGDLIDQDGKRVDGDSDWETVNTTFVGMTEVGGTWGALPDDMMSSNYNYKTGDGKITISSWWGGESTYDIVMEDDKGNVYYKTDGYTGEGGTAIAIANACATLDANKAYRTAKRAWDASGGVRYETITVKGPWQRTDTMEPITESDSIQQLLKWIQVFCGSTFKYEETDIEGIVKTLDPSLQYLGDFAYSVLQEVGASLRVVYGFVNNTMVLEVYRGKDRTHAQTGNPWCVFSDTWGTISGFDASQDDSNYKNTCYVLYEYDEPSGFDSKGRPTLVEVYSEPDEGTGKRTLEGWKVPYETKRGYQTAAIERPGDEPVRETYLDLRKDGGVPSCDSEWSRDTYRVDDEQPNRGKPTLGVMRDQYAQWPDALEKKGIQELEQRYCVITNLDTGTVNTDGYMLEWDLGDKVDFGASSLGLEESARITEIEEVYESKGTGVTSSVGITIGERKLTIVDKAAMAAKRGGR